MNEKNNVWPGYGKRKRGVPGKVIILGHFLWIFKIIEINKMLLEILLSWAHWGLTLN